MGDTPGQGDKVPYWKRSVVTPKELAMLLNDGNEAGTEQQLTYIVTVNATKPQLMCLSAFMSSSGMSGSIKRTGRLIGKDTQKKMREAALNASRER